MEYDLSQALSNAIARNAGNFQFVRTNPGNPKPLTVPRTRDRPDIHTPISPKSALPASPIPPPATSAASSSISKNTPSTPRPPPRSKKSK